jgi:hypothetical protein
VGSLVAAPLITERQLRIAGWVAALALCCASAGVAAQAQRVSGDIVAVEGSTLSLRAGDGDVMRFQLPADVRVSVRGKASWSDIQPGEFIATTAVPQPDGTLRAKEVRIFAESMRGSGEGHYPMATPGDTMTNATVSRVSAARDTMTNATVASAGTAAGAHHMTVTYKGGEKTVVVPDDVPVMTQEPGDRAMLMPGTHAIVGARRAPDGSLTVERLTIGKDGFVPPV